MKRYKLFKGLMNKQINNKALNRVRRVLMYLLVDSITKSMKKHIAMLKGSK